ncbi:MAG TPA: ABC transporter permease [Pyrinomonadaceae bacterium]|nr:ABC transporter permease [Pyrinomonadaceae bacterium]
MKAMLEKLFNLRIWPLIKKELRQIRRNHKLVAMMIFPPTLNLVLLGFAMNPEVTNLRLGVVDESRSIESRELVSAFTESHSFKVAATYQSTEALGHALTAGELDAGIVVPSDFAKQRVSGQTADIQFLVDSVNSNTATIAGGYATRIVGSLNQKINLAKRTSGGAPFVPSRTARVVARISLLYNPGLQNSWFIVTGMIGMLLVMLGVAVASSAMVKEKEIGTIEQLLMTPADGAEIITAKMAPIFLLLSIDIGLSVAVGHLVFGVPVRGSLLLLYGSGMLCVLSGIGIGTIIATFTRSQQQAQLLGFFVTPPLSMLSGATTPIEAMPQWMQPMTLLNPVRHFASLSRGVMLKGVGIEVVYPNLLALMAFTAILMGVSVWRFRKQLN